MRKIWTWVERLLGGGGREVLSLLNPEVVRERGPLVRFLVASGTLAGLIGAAIVGIVAMAALLLSVGAIYYLVTQVLGLRLNVDPKAFYQQFQRQAAAYGAN